MKTDDKKSCQKTGIPRRASACKKPCAKKGSNGEEKRDLITSTPLASRASIKEDVKQSQFYDGHNIGYNETILPIIPNRPQKYSPMPYTFRLPHFPASAIKNGTIKCPPFYLQLDHTISVIWSLFSKRVLEKEIGVAQLQWALSFLKSIVNDKGEHPKDVYICIQTIQDQLLELYADMVNEVKRFNATTKKGYCCCKKKGSTTTSNLSVSEDVNYSENFIKQDVPFSITYADMMRRNPPVQIRQIFKAPAKQVNIDTSKPSTKCPYAAAKLDCSKSREQMVAFLNAWRREQVDKIQAELRRLHSIENFIGNINNNDFQPYLEGKALNTLVDEKSQLSK